MKKGLTLPNRQYEPYTDQEVAALWDLAPEVLVVLAYGESESETQHAAVVSRYVREHPRTRVILRMYSGSEWATDPAEWASECAQRFQFFAQWDAEIIPANEANVEAIGHEMDWAWQVDWLKRWASAFRMHPVSIRIRIHLPALSPHGAWKDGLAAYQASGLVGSYFTDSDIHAYGLHGAGVVSDAYEIVGQAICVTEFNQDDPGAFFEDVSGVADTACYFLLGGTEDQAAYDLLKIPSYYASFRGWTMESNPADSATVEREKIYAIWSLQRIAKGEDPLDKAAFAANVQALGGDPNNLRPWGFPDQQTLSDQIIAKLRELKALLGQV